MPWGRTLAPFPEIRYRRCVSDDAQIFDRDLHIARQERARRTGPDFLAVTAAAELVERLDTITRRFERALVIAPWPDAVAARLRTSGKLREIVSHGPEASENLQLESEGFDAVFSVLDLHAVNDVPGALVQLRRALRPDGLFMACLFAGGTLNELRQSWLEAEARLTGGASPRVAPMIDVRELGALLQRAGFALPVTDIDRTLVRYADPISLMHEIRALGLSNSLKARSRRPVTRGLFGAAAAIYQSRFADPDGRVRATVEVAWAIAWSPHESQPKPLKPGSATTRLADALQVREEKL